MDVFRWTFRRNQNDVIKLYDALSPMMQITARGDMLNFGYWDDAHQNPISAQQNLCKYTATLAQIKDAKLIVDVGSGLSAPATYWKKMYENIQVCCVNINYAQLHHGIYSRIEHVNASAINLPFKKRSIDRIIALESAQHFKPFSSFIKNAETILTNSGLMVLAIPVITEEIESITNLGILKFTWSSEHYSLQHIRKCIHDGGFVIDEEILLGRSVYVPLADYYIKNRPMLKKLLIKEYPSYVETILFKSMQKMKKASKDGIIDYVLVRCSLKNKN